MNASSSSFTDFLLAELKCAALHARLMATEIDSIGVALRGNFIDTDGAMNWLREAGGLGLIAVSSVMISTSAT